jgi:hypothetical protein
MAAQLFKTINAAKLPVAIGGTNYGHFPGVWMK